MKRLVFVALVLTLMLAAALPVAAGEGNGMPSGPHYNLNVIGVPKDKTADMDGNNGHRIFVPLDKDGVKGGTKIILTPSLEGEFQVLDANGTDQDGAELLLPIDVTAEYDVYVRALGKPGGSAAVTSCYTATDGSDWCFSETLTLTRGNGKPVAINASRYLLYVDVCYGEVIVEADGSLTCDGDIETIALFEDDELGYFWDWDNNGLKLAQLRFYPKTVE
jgi:hypothetical protein